MGCILYEMLVGAPPFTGNSAEEVFAAVLNSKESLKFPQEGNQVSAEAKDLIYRFLSPPKERLGYNGVGSIKTHAWFAPINWPALQSMTPPFEVSNFCCSHVLFFFQLTQTAAQSGRRA